MLSFRIWSTRIKRKFGLFMLPFRCGFLDAPRAGFVFRPADRVTSQLAPSRGENARYWSAWRRPMQLRELVARATFEDAIAYRRWWRLLRLHVFEALAISVDKRGAKRLSPVEIDVRSMRGC